jgi:hypothetical protein
MKALIPISFRLKQPRSDSSSDLFTAPSQLPALRYGYINYYSPTPPSLISLTYRFVFLLCLCCISPPAHPVGALFSPPLCLHLTHAAPQCWTLSFVTPHNTPGLVCDAFPTHPVHLQSLSSAATHPNPPTPAFPSITSRHTFPPPPSPTTGSSVRER